MDINRVKRKYGLENAEIHTGWIIRPYFMQSKIPNFESLDYQRRRYEVEKLRKTELLRLQKAKDKSLKQVKKNYRETEPYIHLTYDERISFIQDVADWIGRCSFIRIFGEAVDKIHFDPARTSRTVDEQALEQLVTRFERYMENVSKGKEMPYYGALIHDNNPTVSKNHTELMKRFHKHGTLFTQIKHIIETPLFVDSQLTSMIQIADLCAFALRRYFENGEENLMNRISPRFDRFKKEIVGIRHFTDEYCKCIFCQNKKHKEESTVSS